MVARLPDTVKHLVCPQLPLASDPGSDGTGVAGKLWRYPPAVFPNSQETTCGFMGMSVRVPRSSINCPPVLHPPSGPFSRKERSCFALDCRYEGGKDVPRKPRQPDVKQGNLSPMRDGSMSIWMARAWSGFG